MSNVELEHLIKMINQIADNFAVSEPDDKSATNVATHIKKFWAPSMIDIITGYAQNDGDGLNPLAIKALGLISQ